MPRPILLAILAALLLAASWGGQQRADGHPPPTLRIPDGALAGANQARQTIVRARDAAPARSRDRAALRWLSALDRRSAGRGVPAGRRQTIELTMRVNAWWLTRRGELPRARVILRLPSGLLANHRPGHGFIVNPVATTGRWQGLNDDLGAAGLARALRPLAVVYRHRGRTWLGFEYYDVNGRPREVLPGISAMAQARIATTFARAFRDSGEVRFARTASQVIGAFAVPVSEHGARAELASPDGRVSGTWFPERVYPGKDPWLGAALNGFMASIIDLDSARVNLQAGLREHELPLGQTLEIAGEVVRLGGLVASALGSLESFLPLHDTGSWSIYGMRTGGRPWGTFTADLNYHCYHVTLLDRLDRRRPELGLRAWSDRWQGYVDARGLTCPSREATGATRSGQRR